MSSRISSVVSGFNQTSFQVDVEKMASSIARWLALPVADAAKQETSWRSGDLDRLDPEGRDEAMPL
jgi:hypothetical protein